MHDWSVGFARRGAVEIGGLTRELRLDLSIGGKRRFAVAAAAIASSAAPSASPSPSLAVAVRLARPLGSGCTIAGVVRIVEYAVVIFARRRSKVRDLFFLGGLAVMQGGAAFAAFLTLAAAPAAPSPPPPAATLTLL
jgi:hypothetical protein